MAFFKRFRHKRGERHPSLLPRRRWFRRLALGLISIVGILLFAWLFRTPLRKEIFDQGIKFVESKGIQVEYESVWGNVLGGITFYDLALEQDEDHYLYSEKAHLTYRLLPLLLERRFEIRSVRLIRPQARWLLEEKSADEREPFDPNFSLDLADFHIRSGYLELADTLILDDIQLDTRIRVRPHTVSGRLRRASTMIMLDGIERLRLRSARSNFAYTAPDTIELNGLLLVTANSRIEGDIELKGKSWQTILKKIDVDMTEIDPGGLKGRLSGKGRVIQDSLGYGGQIDLTLSGFKTESVKLADLSFDAQGSGNRFDIELSAQDELGALNCGGQVFIDSAFLLANLDIGALELTDFGGFPLSFEGSIEGKYTIDTKQLETDMIIRELVLDVTEDWPVSFTGSLDADYNLKTLRGRLSGDVEDIKLRNMAWGNCRFRSSFSDDIVSLEEFVLVHGLSQIIAEGIFAADSIGGELKIQSFQMGSLGELNPLKAPVEVDADIHVSGTRDSPAITGLVLARSDEAFFSVFHGELDDFDPLNQTGYANLSLSGVKGLAQDQELKVSGIIRDSELSLKASAGSDFTVLSSGFLDLNFTENQYLYDCTNLAVALVLDTVYNRFPFAVAQAGDSVYISPAFFDVGDGYIGVSGSWHPGQLPRFEMSLSGINLASTGRMLGLPPSTSGSVWGQITSRQDDQRRTILIDLGGRDVYISPFDADSIAFSGSLNTNQLKFDADLIRDNEISTMKGRFTYELADSSLIQSFDINADLNNIGVWPFFMLDEIVAVKEGSVRGQLHATGNFTNPNIEGQIYVRDAELYVPVLNLGSNQAKMDLFFDGPRVSIYDMYALIEQNEAEGVLEGGGFYYLFEDPNRFHFGFRLKEVPYNPDPNLRALISGGINLDGSTQDPLEITGNLDIKEATIGFGLEDEIKVTAINAPLPDPDNPPPPTYVDLSITGNRNIWIKNRDIRAEVKPDLRIVLRNDPMPRITGELSVIRGTFFYFDHQLYLDPTRSRIIFPPVNELNPEFDIWAWKKINEFSGSGEERKPYTIIIHLGGTLLEPIPEFFSDPPEMSESEIIAHLNTTLGGAYITKWLTGSGTQGLQELAGLDIIEIQDVMIGEEVATKITFGKYVNDRLFATYTVSLSEGTPEPGKSVNMHQFLVEYDLDTLKHNQKIVLERDEEGAHSLRYQIKLRY